MSGKTKSDTKTVTNKVLPYWLYYGCGRNRVRVRLSYQRQPRAGLTRKGLFISKRNAHFTRFRPITTGPLTGSFGRSIRGKRRSAFARNER